MHRSRHILVTLTLLALLVPASMIVPSVRSTPVALAASPVSHFAAGKLLYQWSVPRTKHVGAWTNHSGTLAYNGVGVQRLFPHFRLKNVTNFAVEAQMRANGVPGLQASLTGFGLIVAQKPADPHTAVSAGSFYSQNPEDNNPELLWNGDTVGGAAFDPKTSWHLYRLTVQGDQYDLSIDGTPMVAFTIGGASHLSYAGIFSTFFRVSVKNFKVYALGPATTQAMGAPIAKQIALDVTDLPEDGFYIADIQHWYTDEEIARERGVALSTIVATGRIITYGRDIYPRSPDVTGLYSSVTVYATAADARADLAARAAQLEAQAASNSNYSNYQTQANLPVGDASAAFRFQASVGGAPTAFLTYYFVRGRYTCIMDFVFDGSLPATQDAGFALKLAQIVDGRMKVNP